MNLPGGAEANPFLALQKRLDLFDVEIRSILKNAFMISEEDKAANENADADGDAEILDPGSLVSIGCGMRMKGYFLEKEQNNNELPLQSVVQKRNKEVYLNLGLFSEFIKGSKEQIWVEIHSYEEGIMIIEHRISILRKMVDEQNEKLNQLPKALEQIIQKLKSQKI